MLLDTRGNTLSSGTVGYYFDYTNSGITSTNNASNQGAISNVYLFGNCIKNTTSAIKLVHTNPSPSTNTTLPVLIRMDNNYLYNYRYAGLDATDFYGELGFQNSFISNQPNQVADVHYNRVVPVVSIVNQFPISSRRNHFGVDAAPIVGGNGLVNVVHGEFPSVSTCGNQDAGDKLDHNFIDYCDDENWRAISGAGVAQRVLPDASIKLSDDFTNILTTQYQENKEGFTAISYQLMKTISYNDDREQNKKYLIQRMNWLLLL